MKKVLRLDFIKGNKKDLFFLCARVSFLQTQIKSKLIITQEPCVQRHIPGSPGKDDYFILFQDVRSNE